MKPSCPKCGRKSVTFYIRGKDRKYLTEGYYCHHCEVIVRPMDLNPPHSPQDGYKGFSE